MGVGSGLYMYDVVVKRSHSLSYLLMSSCSLSGTQALRVIIADDVVANNNIKNNINIIMMLTLCIQGRVICDSMQRRRLQTRNTGNHRISCHTLRRGK